MRWRVALVVVFCTASAQASRVRFVSDASEPFNRRVIAELENVGFDVDETTRVEEPLPGESVAIVHATNDPPQVEVWLVESAERAVLSTVIERDLRDDDADSTRVAERLRALLQPLVGKSSATLPPAPEPVPPSAAPPPMPPPAAPSSPWGPLPPERRPPREPETSVFGIEAGALVTSQPGGVAVSFLAGLRYDFAHPFAARAFGAFPIAGTTLEEGGASADLDARLLGGTLGFELLPPGNELRVFVGAGGGVVWLKASGSAEPPLRARSVEKVAGFVHVNASLSFVVAGDVTLGFGALLGLGVPRTDIVFDGERVGTWGRPLVGGTLSIGYDL